MKISEYVSLGHSDKVADYITTYILSEALKQDPKTRYAVEVQVKDNYITLGGEVTTNAVLDYPKLCREAVIEIGYTPEYAKVWGKENTIDPDNLQVVAHISEQSNDIKQGVDAEGWGDQGCIAKGTKVLTKNGLVNIENIKAGDYIIYNNKPYLVKNARKTGNKPTIKLITNFGRELVLTADHKVFSNNNWISAENMLGKPIFNKDTGVFGKYDKKIKLECPAFHGGKLNGRYSTFTLDKETAYLMGFLIGDGAIMQDLNFTFCCKLNDKINSLLPKLKKVFEDSSIKIRSNGITIYGKLYREALKIFGLLKWKSADKTVPFSILTANKSIQCSFLRGLYDADGSVILHKGQHGTPCCRIKLSSVSKELINTVYLMLNNLGLRCSLTLNSGVNKAKNIKQNYKCWNVFILGKNSKFKFRELIGFDVEYKKKRLDSYLDTTSKEGIEPKEEYVKKVIKYQDIDVYDLEVEDVHCFYANGILVHNCFFGLAVNRPETNFLPLDYYYAKTLCHHLYSYAKKNYHTFGLDIKTEIVMDDNKIKKVIVAIPCRDESKLSEINQFITPLNPESVVINGTGCYVKHVSWGDCGTTGRKLAVDFYGGNCMIGGGNLWGKDMTKADVTLNFYARALARRYLFAHPVLPYVRCSIACCIGKPEIQISFSDECGFVMEQYEEAKKPSEIINELGLNKNIIKELCANGFTSVF